MFIGVLIRCLILAPTGPTKVHVQLDLSKMTIDNIKAELWLPGGNALTGRFLSFESFDCDSAANTCFHCRLVWQPNAVTVTFKCDKQLSPFLLQLADVYCLMLCLDPATQIPSEQANGTMTIYSRAPTV